MVNNSVSIMPAKSTPWLFLKYLNVKVVELGPIIKITKQYGRTYRPSLQGVLLLVTLVTTSCQNQNIATVKYVEE